ncbi:hypothetical protein GCM10010988_28870 [Cnuibacter physcomitrellae]|uniref:response regulator transcription factor n=1 Tax=Cnuibacter physcomitrellae TaxID=1619308 RepID=UPI00157DC5A6|nr:LuxR C-terminal-related transcriptional regulator [Cnuibacter physcomitrellae]GGI40396.1 hypothetical protein GCM10010988_28870 [Cnuibacter physcomitrellae]
MTSTTAAPGTAELTPREQAVAAHIAVGMSNHAIAEQLGVSVNTIKTLASRSFTKLGVHNRVQLANALRDRSTAGAQEPVG